MMGVVLAAADWWARGIAIPGAIGAISSLVWQVWSWKRTHREHVKVRSTVHPTGSGKFGASLDMTNRGERAVDIERIQAEFLLPGRLGRTPRRWRSRVASTAYAEVKDMDDADELPIRLLPNEKGSVQFLVPDPTFWPNIKSSWPERGKAWQFIVFTSERPHRERRVHRARWR